MGTKKEQGDPAAGAADQVAGSQAAQGENSSLQAATDPNCEHAGKGGSYVFDPATKTRAPSPETAEFHATEGGTKVKEGS